jgi:hypothetical protein
MRNYLGLDIGTSGCKAAVFDERGRMVALAHRDYELHFTPDGGAELDSDFVITRCLEVLAEARTRAGGKVRAMAVSSQGEAFTAVDADGRSLWRAMVSSDVRAAEFAPDVACLNGESVATRRNIGVVGLATTAHHVPRIFITLESEAEADAVRMARAGGAVSELEIAAAGRRVQGTREIRAPARDQGPVDDQLRVLRGRNGDPRIDDPLLYNARAYINASLTRVTHSSKLRR